MALPINRYSFFIREKCNLCGVCFNQCPALNLPLDQAREEIVKLVEGRINESLVFKKCENCSSCDVLCTSGANPYELILLRMYEQYVQKGVSSPARFFLPHHVPNFRTVAISRLPKDEVSLLDSWTSNTLKMKAKGEKEVVYTGCNYLVAPYAVPLNLIKGLKVIGSFGLCCGEMYYRMGLFEAFERSAEDLTGYFQKLNVKKVVTVCVACHNVISNIYPRLGIDPDFETQYLGDWLAEKIDKGKVKVKRKLKGSTTVFDSCHGRLLGKETMENVRFILESIGLDVVEMEHSREKGLCCGIANTLKSQNPFNVLLAAFKRLREASATGADILSVYCGGCLLTFATAKAIYWLSPPLHLTFELLEEAAGYTPKVRHVERGRKILGGTLLKIPRFLLSLRRFWFKELKPMTLTSLPPGR